MSESMPGVGADGCGGQRIAIYGRVSTNLQHVESQLAPLRQYAQQRGFRVVAEITDVGISGKLSSRPGLNRLMDMARKRLIDGVVVWRFDRFARSIRHLLDALQEFKRLGVCFLSYSENIELDSALGQAVFAIVGAMAQLEADLVKERVLMGLARARAEGKRLGRPRTAVSPLRAVEEYERTHSIRKAARNLRVSPATVQRLLRRQMRPAATATEVA